MYAGPKLKCSTEIRLSHAESSVKSAVYSNNVFAKKNLIYMYITKIITLIFITCSGIHQHFFSGGGGTKIHGF
jgi:hypothetical protein